MQTIFSRSPFNSSRGRHSKLIEAPRTLIFPVTRPVAMMFEIFRSPIMELLHLEISPFPYAERRVYKKS
ncbi:hypothetical protein PM082_016706 [Marasmius tenuissimus]|nr:hypothetical protein PM082_016706 [Marasmius tenuissimus]